MKSKPIISICLFFLFMAVTLSSCVKDTDFKTPGSGSNPFKINGDTISVLDVRNILNNEKYPGSLYGDEQFTFEDSLRYMPAYVVSSDEAGNFHNEIILQDKPEEPTAGIRVILTKDPLFTRYEVGRKVYVELKGWTAGFANGVISLGVPEGSEDRVQEAPASFEDKIIRSPEKDSIIPLDVGIDDFSRGYENLLIRLTDVQFAEGAIRKDSVKTFANEPGDGYDGSRILVDCEKGDSTVLLTSKFADFKTMKVPTNRGSISGVLSKTFKGDAYVLKINDPTTLAFEQDRCNDETPTESGPLGQQKVVELPYSEDFSEFENIDMLEEDGWRTIAVHHETFWDIEELNTANTVVQIMPKKTETPIESWLITPGVDLSSIGRPAVLSFDTKDGFNNAEALSVYVSTDFNGRDIQNANWTELGEAEIARDHDEFPVDFTASGEVGLSEFERDTVYIGFKYEGDPGLTTAYRLNQVSVKKSGEENEDEDKEDDKNQGNATPAFAGGDFEDWGAFLGGLEGSLKSYVEESKGNGIDESTALRIHTDPGTTNNNDEVFKAKPSPDLSVDYRKLTFYLKGFSNKSVSINLYQDDGSSYQVFNLGNLSESKVISPVGGNRYANLTIDTGGEWVKVELDLSGLDDLNTGHTSEKFFGLKIGSNADYDLYFDEFTIK